MKRKPETPITTISVRFPVALKAELQRIAIENDRTLTTTIIRACRLYIERKARSKNREGLYQVGETFELPKRGKKR